MSSRAVGGGRGLILSQLADVVGQPNVLVDPEEVMSYGDCWHVLSAATAALTAVPSTTAGHSLWNGEPANGKWYQIDMIAAVEITVDSTQQNSLSLFAMMTKGAFTAPTDAGLARGSWSGRDNYGGSARTVAGATVVDHVWSPVGPASPANTQLTGSNWRVTEAWVRPRGWFLPPGGLFSVAAVKSVGTASQIRYSIHWREVPRIR